MKPIQVSIDEGLLARLDADAEVQRDGRSAVLRRAIVAYLADKRARAIADAYRGAYADGSGLGAEFAGWESQGTWPDE